MLQDMGLQRVLHDCETEQQQKVWDTIRGPENLTGVKNAIRINTDAGRDWGQEEKGMTEDKMAGGITDSMDVSLGELQELVMAGRLGMLRFMGSQRVGHDWVTELNWTKPTAE